MSERDQVAIGSGWVEVTVRVSQEVFVHPEIVRDDLLEALDWDGVSAVVTDTSPGYMEAHRG